MMHNSRSKAKIKFVALLVAIILLWYLGSLFHIKPQSLQKSLEKFPLVYSGIIFVLLYVVVTFFIWLSKDIFKIVGAVIFGATISTLFIWVAETANAFILFRLSRFLGRNFVENSLKGKFKDLDRKLTKVNFFWLFMFRAVPLVPFRFMDLALGLSKISFRKYLVVVILGSPLRIFWVQYIASCVGTGIFGSPAALAKYLMANKVLFNFSFIYLVLVILVAWKIKFRD